MTPEEDRPAAVPPDPVPGPRRYPSTIGGGLYLVALLGVGVGLVLAILHDWRFGVSFSGGSLIFAAGCRLLLPGHHAGMLAVRNRWFDTVLLVLLGAALLFLALTIPNQAL